MQDINTKWQKSVGNQKGGFTNKKNTAIELDKILENTLV